MAIFLMSFVIIALAILGMAVGVLLGRRPIAGSCGGLGQLGLACDSCDKPCAKKRRVAGLSDS
jgi:hypothetical protein